MEMLIGVVFWGGLLVLTLAWIGRGSGSSGRHTSSSTRTDGTAPWAASSSPGVRSHPATRRSDAEVVKEHRLREDEALADGLVIGHFLTRDHYRARIDALEGDLDALGEDRDRWLEAAATGDDLYDDLDYAEFDAMGGYGVEPWADDLLDLDDED